MEGRNAETGGREEGEEGRECTGALPKGSIPVIPGGLGGRGGGGGRGCPFKTPRVNSRVAVLDPPPTRSPPFKRKADKGDWGLGTAGWGWEGLGMKWRRGRWRGR